MTTERLFVYGSLKRGGRHHAELQGAFYVAEACTRPGYALVSVGDYLGLVESAGAGSVVGELFVVPEALLPTLDEFEGDAYIRARLEVVPADGNPVLVLAYLARRR